jgi:hypothetical protein
MVMRIVGAYQYDDTGNIVWKEYCFDVPEGSVVLIDEPARGAWADPKFLSNVLDILYKAEVEKNDNIKDILMDVELEKVIYDNRN